MITFIWKDLKALSHNIMPNCTVGSKLTAHARLKYAEACVLPRINTAYYAMATDSYRVLKTSR